MCQIADVRGLKVTGPGRYDIASHGFWEYGGDTCTGITEFCVGAFDDEELAVPDAGHWRSETIP